MKRIYHLKNGEFFPKKAVKISTGKDVVVVVILSDKKFVQVRKEGQYYGKN